MNTLPFGQVPMYQNPYQPAPMSNFIPKPTMVSNNVTWVQGIEGAKAYQIPQNSNVILMDSEQNRMYIKTSDNIGMCSLRMFDFTEVTDVSNSQNPSAPEMDMSQYVTKKELADILSTIKGDTSDEHNISTTKSSKSNASK